MGHALRWTLVGMVGCAGYAIACWRWPFAACFRCEGGGKKRSPGGRAWRRCWVCKGSGERLRIGRKAWNMWARVKRDGE